MAVAGPPITEVVTGYLDRTGLPSWWETPGEVVAFPASTESHSWMVYALCMDERDQLLIHSVRDGRIPEQHRPSVGAFLHRANFGVVLGNFELDLDDGELRFKTSIDVGGDRLSDALVEHLMLANVAAFGRYLPGVDDVLAGADPHAAIEAVEAAEPAEN